MIASKFSTANRKEIKVPKKPLASWMALVAMMSVPISAHIDPLDRNFLPPFGRSRGTMPSDLIRPCQDRAPRSRDQPVPRRMVRADAADGHLASVSAPG